MGGIFNLGLSVCGILVMVLIVGGGAYYLLVLRKKKAPAVAQSGPRVQAPAQAPAGQPAQTAASGVQLPPALLEWSDSYKLGDELLDDSSAIELPTGEFVGECGMSISENIGVGEPKKVTAFEVWLFDKNDYQTVTHVLASNYAVQSPDYRDKLAPRGQLVEVAPGAVTTLETATLMMTVTITDMAYGSGPGMPNSYFDRLAINFAVRQKPQPAA